MNSRKMVMCVGILLAMAVTGPAGAADDEASCLLKITWDPDTLPLDAESLGMLVYSSGITKRAVEAVLGDEAARRVAFDNFEEDPPARVRLEIPGDEEDGVLLGRLAVTVNQTQPAKADELLMAICERLRTALHRAHQADVERLEEQMALAARELDVAQQEVLRLQESRRILCAGSGRADLSRDDLVDEIGSLQDERRELEMQLHGQRALRHGLEERIARIGQRLETVGDEDEIAGELERLVELRQSSVTKVQTLIEKGMARGIELAEPQAELTEAKIALAEHRAAVVDRLGAGRLEELNEELAEIAMHTVELESRLELTNRWLEQINEKDLLELADRIEREVEIRLPLTIEAVEEAAEWQRILKRRRLTIRPPGLTVLGGTEDREKL